MKRLHLLEIQDQDWCPRAIRNAVTDYLQFVIAKTKPYAAMVPILTTALQRTGTREILDLCSGAGGPWLWLQPIRAGRGLNVSVCLTDKYPNLDAIGQACRPPDQTVRYHPQPVDATRVPDELAEGLDANNYQWEIGEVKSTAGPIPITHLIGVPIDRGA
jgi:hypothetical protein